MGIWFDTIRVPYTEHENELMLKLRKRFSMVGQRNLARQIAYLDLPKVWNNKVMLSGLFERSYQSIYSVIRRIDRNDQKKRDTEALRDFNLSSAAY